MSEYIRWPDGSNSKTLHYYPTNQPSNQSTNLLNAIVKWDEVEGGMSLLQHVDLADS
jgi:hypothetical protein